MRACTGCGKCCVKYGAGAGLGCATDNDIARLSVRPDISVYIHPSLGDLWISPVTGEETARCPWLRKLPGRQLYKCRIHDVRPDICRDYPVNIQQMIEDECEMLEPGDHQKSRQQLAQELVRLRNASP